MQEGVRAYAKAVQQLLQVSGPTSFPSIPLVEHPCSKPHKPLLPWVCRGR